MAFFAVVPAAGNGFRFGASIPKQYLPLCGKPVLQHAIERLHAQFELRRMYVVLAPDDHWFEALIDVPDNTRLLRTGAATRAGSVRNALKQIGDAQDDDWVVVHDAVRPCLDPADSARLQRELEGDDVGGFLAVPVSDTLKRVDANGRVVRTESRERLWRAQTPQMFRCGVLRRAFTTVDGDAWTDEAHAVEALGLAAKCIAGNPGNVKITFPEDMALAAAILAGQAVTL